MQIVQRTMDLAVTSSFVRLGAGSFATIFVSYERAAVVVKQVKDPLDVQKIYKEHEDLQHLYSCCSGPEQLFKLPRPLGFFDSYTMFAQAAGISRTEDLGLPPHALYVMERIWPVPHKLALQIKEIFFPEDARSSVTPTFLARLYFGREKETSRFFNTENFPLYASRMEKLGLPAAALAKAMGEMLASINFVAGRDGRDIEFVLAGNPVNPWSPDPWFACIDFNQMRPHQGNPEVICGSIVSNDPYYPRPNSPYWSDFVSGYTASASKVNASELASSVVSLISQHWLATVEPRLN